MRSGGCSFRAINYYDSTRYLTLVYLPAPDVANKVARWFYEGGEAVSSSYAG
jgi:hypothetical protein